MTASFRQRYKILRLRGARIVAATLVVLLAGTWLWFAAVLPERESFTLYFTSNIHGLSVGAPVQMNGQNVGEVDSIRIVTVPATDIRRKYYAAVTISLKSNAFGISRYQDDSLQDRLPDLIKIGLRGQLRMPSLLANGLCVSLYFAPGQPVNYINPPNAKYPEIPTNFKSTSDLVDQINTFIETKNLYAVSEKIRMLRTKILEISESTERFDARALNRKILDRLDFAEHTISPKEFHSTLVQTNATLISACEILERHGNTTTEQIRTVCEDLEKLSQTLRRIREHAQAIRAGLSDDSILPELQHLQEIRERCAPFVDLGKIIFF